MPIRTPFSIDPKDYTRLIRLYRKVYDTATTRISDLAMGYGTFVQRYSAKVLASLWNRAPREDAHFTLTRGDGSRVRIPFDSRNTQFHALYLTRYQHGYEPEVCAFVDAVLREDSVFYDIGANWGFFALFVATKPMFRGQVFAFEPNPKTYNDLVSITRAAQFSEVIKAHPVALSHKTGKGRMSFPDKIHSGLARLDESGESDGTVTVRRLDDLQLPDPHIMKVDVEGHEPFVFFGARKTLQRAKPFIIFESCVDEPQENDAIRGMNSPMGVFELLEEIGYSFFHPAWLVDGINLPSQRALFRAGEKRYTLTRFRSSERLLFSKKINCIACHNDRFEELFGSGFEESDLSP